MKNILLTFCFLMLYVVNSYSQELKGSDIQTVNIDGRNKKVTLDTLFEFYNHSVSSVKYRMNKTGETAYEAYQYCISNYDYIHFSADTFRFNRIANVANVKNKLIEFETGTVLILDTLLAGESLVNYRGEGNGSWENTGLLSFFECDNIKLVGSAVLDAANIRGNIPLTTSTGENEQRSTHCVQFDSCKNVEIDGLIFKNGWFGAYLQNTNNSQVRNISFVVDDADTLNGGALRRSTVGEWAIGNFNNSCVTYSNCDRIKLENCYSEWTSEIVDFNPDDNGNNTDAIISGLSGLNIWEAAFETSTLLDYSVYNIYCKNCKYAFSLNPYGGGDARGNIFGATAVYTADKPEWVNEVTPFRVNSSANCYGLSLIIEDGVTIKRALEVKSESNAAIELNISMGSGSSFSNEHICFVRNTRLNLEFNGYLTDNQQLIHSYNSTINAKNIFDNSTSIGNVFIKSFRGNNTYFVNEMKGFEVEKIELTGSNAKNLKPVDLLYPDYSISCFSDNNGDDFSVTWQGETSDLTTYNTIYYNSLFHFDQTAYAKNINLQMTNVHRVTLCTKFNHVNNSSYALYAFGNNDPYRIRYKENGTLNFSTSVSGFTSSDIAFTIDTTKFYIISVIINKDSVEIRAGEAGGTISKIYGQKGTQDFENNPLEYDGFYLGALKNGDNNGIISVKGVTITNGNDAIDENLRERDEALVSGLTPSSFAEIDELIMKDNTGAVYKLKIVNGVINLSQ
jgi:hypothetical protein